MIFRIVLLAMAGMGMFLAFASALEWTPAQAANRPSTTTVRMTREHSFEPQVILVFPGDEVVWQNDDHAVHSVVSDILLVHHRSDVEPPAPPEPFHSDDLAPGQSYRRVFTLEGVYRYVCLHHEEVGMNGTVIVSPRQ
jgi:plastocyanin